MNPNKKVCILTSVHPVFDTRIFYREAKTLVDAGYNVTLIAQHNKNETVDEIKIIALPKPKSRFSRMFVTTWRTFYLAKKQRANVYHFHDPELIPIGILLKIFTKAKIIYDAHEEVYKDILCKKWVNPLLRKPIAWFLKKIEKFFSKYFDCIIAAYYSIAKEFTKHKVVIIENYPSITIFSQIQKENKRQKNNYTLIYVGGMSPFKGINEIIEALNFIDYPNVRLKLIGKFSDKQFENRIKNLKSFNKIDYLGFQPQRQAWCHLINADVGMACFHPVHKE